MKKVNAGSQSNVKHQYKTQNKTTKCTSQSNVVNSTKHVSITRDKDFSGNNHLQDPKRPVNERKTFVNGTMPKSAANAKPQFLNQFSKVKELSQRKLCEVDESRILNVNQEYLNKLVVTSQSIIYMFYLFCAQMYVANYLLSMHIPQFKSEKYFNFDVKSHFSPDILRPKILCY